MRIYLPALGSRYHYIVKDLPGESICQLREVGITIYIVND